MHLQEKTSRRCVKSNYVDEMLASKAYKTMGFGRLRISNERPEIYSSSFCFKTAKFILKNAKETSGTISIFFRARTLGSAKNAFQHLQNAVVITSNALESESELRI